jgi:oligogalacturonide lyase
MSQTAVKTGVGKRWTSEMIAFQDTKTGRFIRQLTSSGNNVHLYFTENAFTKGADEVIFLSDRASGENKAPHEYPHYNLFAVDLASGEITQLTDEAVSINKVTKTPDSSLLVYTTGKQVKGLERSTNKTWTIYEETETFALTGPSISADRHYVGFARNEGTVAASGPNYSGFADRYYRIKDGRITLATLDGNHAFDVLRDTHQLAHFQFSPLHPTRAMFCHEGPWHLVTQRMWGIDVVSRTVLPYFRQDRDDAVGHEFWTRDGHIFFDNRGPGHDGTITSDKTQAVATPTQNSFVPFVGLLNVDGKLLRKLEMPFYCNHYHANPDNTFLVGDDVDDLVLIDLRDKAKLTTLCTHGTSWHTQASHCHPTWDWEGKRILYASDNTGQVQLYLLEPEGMV